ncbi:hypothetical protein KM043_005819 [Ampulex compressa]|nr:hypothetical protein KM043_005819 [Ampulex compressa]
MALTEEEARIRANRDRGEHRGTGLSRIVQGVRQEWDRSNRELQRGEVEGWPNRVAGGTVAVQRSRLGVMEYYSVERKLTGATPRASCVNCAVDGLKGCLQGCLGRYRCPAVMTGDTRRERRRAVVAAMTLRIVPIVREGKGWRRGEDELAIRVENAYSAGSYVEHIAWAVEKREHHSRRNVALRRKPVFRRMPIKPRDKASQDRRLYGYVTSTSKHYHSISNPSYWYAVAAPGCHVTSQGQPSPSFVDKTKQVSKRIAPSFWRNVRRCTIEGSDIVRHYGQARPRKHRTSQQPPLGYLRPPPHDPLPNPRSYRS